MKKHFEIKKLPHYLQVGAKECLASFLDIFRLAYKGVYFPLMLLFNSSAKTVDDAYKGVKKVAKVKPKKEEGALTTSEILERKIKDLLGITQAELAALDKERRELLEQLQTPEASARKKEAVPYRYKVKDAHGRIIEDTFFSFSQAEVNSFLLNEGYEVYSIKNDKTIDFLYGQSSFVGGKWSTKDLVFWLTRISTYIKAGVPLTDAIRILGKQVNKKQVQVMRALDYELTMGNPFSKALEKQGNVFPQYLINMIRTAEATGDLESALDELAEYYTETEETRKEMINALTYPALIMVFAIGVTIFIIMYVVPQFEDIYASNGVAITGITKLVLDISAFLESNIFNLIFVVLIVVIGFYMAYKEVKAFRKFIQTVLMKIPVIGNIIIYKEIAIFSKTFSSLLKNNVYIMDSIDILSKITNNELYKEIMFETIENIARGDKISEAFKDNWIVPDVAYYMILTGESTGQLASMLDTVSHHFQGEHKAIIGTMKAFIEPITIIFLAVIVGGIILAVIVPMFNMYSQLSA